MSRKEIIRDINDQLEDYLEDDMDVDEEHDMSITYDAPVTIPIEHPVAVNYVPRSAMTSERMGVTQPIVEESIDEMISRLDDLSRQLHHNVAISKTESWFND